MFVVVGGSGRWLRSNARQQLKRNAFIRRNSLLLIVFCNVLKVPFPYVDVSLRFTETRTAVKVKVTLLQALRLCTGRTAHRGSSGIALPFHDHGTRKGWGVSVTPRPLFTPRKDPVLIVQEVEWAPGPVWTGAEKLAPTGFRSPDRPARSSVAIRTTLPGSRY